ncbi:unnamed protein product [Kuraishia capsulata CBS 1993]|uniref:GPI2-domain-containing protein n=1 Tax=Kuraishia capsulata CBS 1993 TaxID=1382522 RepID=W6MML8_9ASCO|nr:uncharacterized protein KUCA_T00003785001 [Kuraishia capsulata CBS 1993]CDK27806.1 unnamed protein product [Kuraishia capsulata CBS 1993]
MEVVSRDRNANHRPLKFAERPERKQWKKLLWLKQDYPDNYTDKSFLSQLKRNSTVVNYSYLKLVNDFTLIVLHLSVLALVNIVFFGVYSLDWNPVVPTFISSTLTMAGFAIYVFTLKRRHQQEVVIALERERKLKTNKFRPFIQTSRSRSTSRQGSNVPSRENSQNRGNGTLNPLTPSTIHVVTESNPPSVANTLKSCILIVLTLLTFSPVLKSLTNSTSSDSIWALSTWLCFFNVLFNDYTIEFPSLHHHDQQQQQPLQQQQHTQVSNSNISKNLSLSNAIVLASRLNSNLAVFCFIVFSIQLNGLFPMFNNFTRKVGYTRFHWFQVTVVVLGVDIAVYQMGGLVWLLCWTIAHFTIIMVGPAYFLALQKYKDELQGPWDPAQPILKNNGL